MLFNYNNNIKEIHLIKLPKINNNHPQILFMVMQQYHNFIIIKKY